MLSMISPRLMTCTAQAYDPLTIGLYSALVSVESNLNLTFGRFVLGFSICSKGGIAGCAESGNSE